MNQDNDTRLNRRVALGTMLQTMGGLATIAVASTNPLLGAEVTPIQPEGPFYPIKDQLDKDADLTTLVGASQRAKGTLIKLVGEVIDADTEEPIQDALVEFWQACATGRYNHPRDSNTAALDPNFQYWAQVRTGEAGDFGIVSIIPGAYKASSTWVRPPHIHVKVHKRGYPSLTTQMYFDGDQLNERDDILRRLTKEQRERLIVSFDKDETDAAGKPIKVGTWRIVIAKMRPIDAPQSRLIITPDTEH